MESDVLTLKDVDTRVRILERDVAVIKSAVENHIPSSIAEIKNSIAGLHGLLIWFFGLAIGGLITGVVQLALKYAGP